MDFGEISMIYHIGIVFGLLWICAGLNYSHPILYFASLLYLYQVHERYNVRLRKKLQFEERKTAYQKRLLSDSETVRWLNHAVEKVWPICMEQIASQHILLPIIPWFLEKYKPWTAKEAVVQHLYLGRTPPMFTEIRVLRQSSDDDHLVLELGMNFLTADDMSAILAVKLRRRLGFGMWAKLHVTGMHIEGKVLVGVKFLREWPFLGRLRVCFVEPPYFQMTVKPIVSHGLDVTELPGIAGWLDKLLSVAFEQTLVEPNMLVVDMEKFASASTESWFTVDEKDPIAYLKVEIVEAADVKPSDPNGRADPYVKGQLGPYRFRTQTQKKTLTPKWMEDFKIPIFTWETQNILALKVCDKDHFVDDTLGDCSININDMKDGQRHDMWLSLQKIVVGRLHVAVTVLDVNREDEDYMNADKSSNKKDGTNTITSETAKDFPISATTSKNAQKISDEFEPIKVEGQQKTGIWVHHPGNDVSPTWEPRKRTRQADIQIQKENKASLNSPPSVVSGGNANSSNSSDENAEGNKSKSHGSFRKSIRKIGSVFHGDPKLDGLSISEELCPTPDVNIQAVDETGASVNIIMDDTSSEVVRDSKAAGSLILKNEEMSRMNDNKRGMAKSILKQAGHGVKHLLTRKGSRKSRDDATFGADNLQESYSSESTPSSLIQHKPALGDISTNAALTPTEGVKSPDPKEQTFDARTPDSTRYRKATAKNVSFEAVAKTAGPG